MQHTWRWKSSILLFITVSVISTVPPAATKRVCVLLNECVRRAHIAFLMSMPAVTKCYSALDESHSLQTRTLFIKHIFPSLPGGRGHVGELEMAEVGGGGGINIF